MNDTATLSPGLIIGLADYGDQRDAADVVTLLEAYARLRAQVA